MNFVRETLVGTSVTCVRLSAPEVEAEGHSVNIVVVLDISGSMEDGFKLHNVILSLEQLLTYMRDEDFLTVVPFNGTVQRPFPVCQEPCTVTGKSVIQEKLAALRAGGNTDLGIAIQSASEVLALPLPLPAKSAVLLLTDGAATAGELDHARLVLLQQANLAAYPEALFCTVGYGDDHEAELCRRLALNGPYSIVRSGEDVGAVIGDLLGGLRTTVASSVRLVVPAHIRQRTTFKLNSANEICIGNLVAGGNQVILLEGLAAEDSVGLRYSLSDGSSHLLANIEISGPSSEIQEAGGIALLRCEVLEIMEHARQYLTGRSPVMPAAVLEQSLVLRAKLEALPSSPATVLLLRELNRAHGYLSAPPPPAALARHLTNQLSQHTEYLGTARGIMSHNEEEDEDPEDRNTSIFSSTVQRAMSSGMAQAVRSVTLPLSPGGSGNPRAPSLAPLPPPPPFRTLSRTHSSAPS